MDHETDIRTVLINRIRELKSELEKTQFSWSKAYIEDMLAVNKRIYYFIFRSEV